MDPFARKMLQGSLMYGAALIVLFLALTGVYLHVRPRCSDQLITESPSPDQHWGAAVMQRRCGEESPFLTHVNLRARNSNFRVGFFSGEVNDGEVFLIELDSVAAGVNIRWLSPTKLAIDCAACPYVHPRERKAQWQDVAVEYEYPAGR